MPTNTATPTHIPSPAPTKTPTLVPDGDYDRDGLSNYDELVKYKTDPYDSDSDGDGTRDDDWDERREYVYSVHVVMKIRQPFNVDEMNDSFQDVKVISGPDEHGYTKLDILIFPDTRPQLVSVPYPQEGLSNGLLALTEPGISTNYNQEMKEEVVRIAGEAKTDVQAVETILRWTDRHTKLVDPPYRLPVSYYTYIDNGTVKLRNYTSEIPIPDLLKEQFYADSMFERRVHGTCCSTATFKCAMIKAAGIPCRTIQTLFPIFSHQDQSEPYENKLRRDWSRQWEDQPSGERCWWVNHCFMEVYLGRAWVRVDNRINVYMDSEGHLSVKILSVADLTDVDFSKTYPVDWVNNRPYYALLIEDQSPIH